MIKGHMIRVPKLSAIEICITVCVILYPIAGLLNVYSSIFSYVDELLMLVTVGHGCIYGMKSIGAKYNPIKKKVHSIGGIHVCNRKMLTASCAAQEKTPRAEGCARSPFSTNNSAAAIIIRFSGYSRRIFLKEKAMADCSPGAVRGRS